MVPLHGPGYNTNNRSVWHKIQNFCIRTTPYNWIKKFEANEDGRAAWLALIQQYEGTDSENKRIILANQAISLHTKQGLLYKNKQILSFAKYTAGLQAEFAASVKYQNKVTQETMVQQLINGIKTEINLNITLANTKVKNNKLGNWIGAVSYMATKITKAFGFKKDNKNQ